MHLLLKWNLVPLFLARQELAACEIKQPESSLFYYFLVVFLFRKFWIRDIPEL